MPNQIIGHSVHSIGQVGAADDGKIVHFEFIDPNGQKVRYLVPYDRMSLILFGLQSAMQIATEEIAKRPGFNPAQAGIKLGLEYYGTGQAVAPGKDPLVVLHLQTKSAIVLDLLLPLDQAEQLGNDLIAKAQEIQELPEPKPS